MLLGYHIMSEGKIDLVIGLIGDDHILSLFNIQSDDDLNSKFQFIAPSEWKETLQLKVKNYGVVGDCTSDLVEKIDGSFLDQALSLDYAIILIGTNDVQLNVPISEIVKNLKQVLNIMLENNVPPIFCTLLPLSREDYSQTITDLNSIMTIFCAENHIKVVDLNLAFNDGGDKLDEFYDIGDGIHLTRDGYMFLADNLLLRVREIITEEVEDYQNNHVKTDENE